MPMGQGGPLRTQSGGLCGHVGLSYEMAIELVEAWLAWYHLPPLFDEYIPVFYTRGKGKSGDNNGHQDHVSAYRLGAYSSQMGEI